MPVEDHLENCDFCNAELPFLAHHDAGAEGVQGAGDTDEPADPGRVNTGSAKKKHKTRKKISA